MIRTLAWKEYREQRGAWIALAVLAILLIVALVQFVSPEGVIPRESEKVAVIMVIFFITAGTYGLVCGALLVAGERESRTLAFLDALARERTPLWWTKVLTGGALTMGHALVLAVLALVLGLPWLDPVRPAWLGPILWWIVLVLVEWITMAWALFFASWWANVLVAVTLGGLVQVEVLYLAFLEEHYLRTQGLGFILSEGGLALAALWGSWWFFCRRDRQRNGLAGRSPGVTPLLWLISRQGRLLVIVLFGAGLILACTPRFSMVWWPFLTLLVGIVCGTAAFAPEQIGEVHRFLGDQRFPPGRLWWVKIGLWAILAGVVIWLILLGGFLAFQDLHSSGQHFLFPLLGPDPDASISATYMGPLTFALLWVVYGFSISQFFALAMRKSLVAVVLSLLVSGVVLLVWLPSLVWGGVMAWQVFAIPVALLVASRRGMWTWITGRLQGRPLALYLGGTGLFMAAWMAGNFWYRIHQVPDVGEPFDVNAFETSMPTPEENQAGRLILNAADELSAQEQGQWEESVSPHVKGITGIPAEYQRPLHEVLLGGWPAQDEKLGPWLDQMFQGSWAQDLQKAASLPLGIVFGPQDMGDGNSRHARAMSRSADAGILLAARALQLQARGDPQAALDHLSWALALSRNLRNRSVRVSFFTGLSVEERAFQGFDVWLLKLGPRPELLRRALEELKRHEDLTPPLDDSHKAEYLVCRSLIHDPLAAWNNLASREDDPVGWLALSFQPSWEKARQVRLLNYYYQYPPVSSGWEVRTQFPWWPEPNLLRAMCWMDTTGEQPGLLSLRFVRAERLKTALALNQVQEGKPAASLQDLTPRYLAEIPLDPYRREPFHYRLSKGEKIRVWVSSRDYWEPVNIYQLQEFQMVPAGQGILWSGPSAPGDDLTFLVPSWTKPKGG